MRHAVILALAHGSSIWQMLEGPETPIPEQRTRLKALRRLTTHAEFAEVQLWESDSGVVLRHRMKPTPEVAAAIAAVVPPEPPAEPQVESPAVTDAVRPSVEATPGEVADDGEAAGDFNVPAGDDHHRRSKKRR